MDIMVLLQNIWRILLILILTAILGKGFIMEGLTSGILVAGMMPYFIIFMIMSMIGIGIAYKEAYS